MKKVIIKLKGEAKYWKAQTEGTTKDINEAHHFDENEALRIIKSSYGGLEIIDIFEECTKIDPEILKDIAVRETLELIECDCVSMKDFCDCDDPNPGVQGKFEGILTSLNSLLEYKNEKYGNVALEPLNIFAKYGGIGQRIDDKLSRIKNSEELRKNDVADMLGYLVLLCKEHGFENFDEFKD
jgi:hypothetical protein